MKWLLIVGFIVIILNARATLARHSNEDFRDSSDSSKSSGPRPRPGPSGPGPRPGHSGPDSRPGPPGPGPKHGPPGPGPKHGPPGPGPSPGPVSSPKSNRRPRPVKIVRVNVMKLDEEYFSRKSLLQLIQLNSYENALKVDLTIKKSLPSNTRIVVKIYGSTSISGGYEVIREDVSFGATETTSRYYEYLPRGLIQYININGGLVKGRITSENFGYFKFYRLLSVEQLRYAYYKVVFNYECEDEVILSHDYRFQSLEPAQPQSC